MTTMRFKFMAATSESFEELELRAGYKTRDDLLNEAVAAYSFSQDIEGDISIGHKFAAINFNTLSYKPLTEDIAELRRVYQEDVSINVDEPLLSLIKQDFGHEQVEEVLSKSLCFMDRLLDTRDEGFNSVGFINRNNEIQSIALCLPGKPALN